MKTKLITLFAIFNILCSWNFLFAQEIQNTSNIWYFGNKAGLNFNTDPPTALTDGQLNTQEGVATIADNNGQLLFYTDGITVWDRTHQTMPNGNNSLNGHESSTQSGIIVPNLGNSNLYYIFTVDELAGSDGLSYSTVDISMEGNGTLANPLGNIVSSELNISLATPVTEKITGVLKPDFTGYWIIAHGWNNNQFYAFEVTCDGINPEPVISEVGNIHSGGTDNINAVGYMRATIDGEKLALVNRNNGTIDIYDFDNNTGMVSNEIEITPFNNLIYGIEFSITGSFLYIGGSTTISRYNMSSGEHIPISFNSSIPSSNVVRALQLGPDGNIYVSLRNSNYISVIYNPDGNFPELTVDGIFLNPDNVGRNCRFGLPNIFYFDVIPPDTVHLEACTGTAIEFNNEYYSAGSINEISQITADGCDSIFILAIDEVETATQSIEVEACQGGFYEYNGNQIPTGTQESFNFSNPGECDSIVTIIVNPIDLNNILIEEEACEGSFFNYQGTLIPAGEQQNFIFTDTNGCDSLVLVVVELTDAIYTSLEVEACQGSFYDYDGSLIPAGTQESFTFSNSENCDSIVTIVVNSIDLSNTTFQAEACEDSFFDYQGTLIPAGEQQTFTFVDSNGCDSTVLVIVESASVTNTSLEVEACQGSFYDYNGILIPAGSQESFIFSISENCDSIVTITVNVIDLTNIFLQEEACEDAFFDYQGTLIPAGDQQLFTFTDYNGCDSTVLVVVASNEIYDETLEFEACSGTFYNYNGIDILAGNQESFNFSTVNNCDSNITVIINEVDIIEQFINLELCEGENYNLNGIEFPIGTDTTFIVTNQLECDTIFYIEITPSPNVEFDLLPSETCWNSNDGTIDIQNIVGGVPPFEFSIDGENFTTETTINNLAAQLYTLTLIDSNSCLHFQDVEVPQIPEILIDYTPPIIACEDDSILLLVNSINTNPSDITWNWFDGTNENYTYIFEPGIYNVEISNDCQLLKENISVGLEDDPRESYFFIPNIFSPNNDGNNDQFQIFPSKDIEILNFEIHIFNRWGALIFESNDLNESWNGTFKDKVVENGVYTWWMEADIRACKRNINFFKKGDITIVK